MTDVQDYKARVSAEGIDETLAQLRGFSQQVTSIIKSTQTIQKGLSEPLNAANQQITTFSQTVKSEVGKNVTSSFEEATKAAGQFASGLTGIGIAAGAMAIGAVIRESIMAFANMQDAMLRIIQTTKITEEQQTKLAETFHELQEKVGVEDTKLAADYYNFSVSNKMQFEESREAFIKIEEYARNAGVPFEVVAKLSNEHIANLKLDVKGLGESMDGWLTVLGPMTGEYERFFSRMGPLMKVWNMETKEAKDSQLAVFSVLSKIAGGGPRGAMRTERAAEEIESQLLDPTTVMGRLANARSRAGIGIDLQHPVPDQLITEAQTIAEQQGALIPGPLGVRNRRRIGLSESTAGFLMDPKLKAQLAETMQIIAASKGANDKATANFREAASANVNKFGAVMSESFQNMGRIATLRGDPSKLPWYSMIPLGVPASISWILGRLFGVPNPTPGLQHGGIVHGSSEGTQITVGEGGVGHDEAIVPLSHLGTGGAAVPATRDNTLVTQENTSAINRLISILRPISERAAAARASVQGALVGFGTSSGGAGGGTSPTVAPAPVAPAAPAAPPEPPFAGSGGTSGGGGATQDYGPAASTDRPIEPPLPATFDERFGRRRRGRPAISEPPASFAERPPSTMGPIDDFGQTASFSERFGQQRRGRPLVGQTASFAERFPSTLSPIGDFGQMAATPLGPISDFGQTSSGAGAASQNRSFLLFGGDDGLTKMQGGGVVKAKSGGTPVILGEGGEDEMVIPLKGQRAGFAEQLKDPAVHERMYRLITTENPENPQAFMENVMNRAAARKHSLLQEMNNRGYYPGVSIRGAAPSAEQRVRYTEAEGAVLGGSNITGFATGNASLNVGFGYGGGARDPYTFKDPKSGERYGIENNPADIAWAKKMGGADMTAAAAAASHHVAAVHHVAARHAERHHQRMAHHIDRHRHNIRRQHAEEESRPIRLSVEYPTLPPLVAPKREFAQQRFHGNTDRAVTMASNRSHSDSWYV